MGNCWNFALFGYVPDIQERSVAGSGDLTAGFAAGTIQSGTNFFFFEPTKSASGTLMAAPAFRRSRSLRIVVHNEFVFPIASLRDIHLHHGLEVSRSGFQLGAPHKAPLILLKP